MPSYPVVVTFCLALVLAGCGDGASLTDAGADAAHAEDAGIDALAPGDAGPSGPARAVTDLDGVNEDFFAFPFPSDLRLDDRGAPNLDGFPTAGTRMVAQLVEASRERRGWPVVPVAFFRFTAPLGPRTLDTIHRAEPTSPFLLVDVDPDSPSRGALVPTVAVTLAPDRYTGANLVAVAAMPGWILHPERTYAFVVRADAGGWDGGPIELEPRIQALLVGEAPATSWGERARAVYAPLRETLAMLGIAPREVATATVFTTADVVAELRALVEGVRARDDVTIENLAVDPEDGARHERYCELVGTVEMPQFQVGTPPFDTEGRFRWGSDGLPIEQRRERIPVVITIPRTAMPLRGYPWMHYLHGSGGVAAQVVDRGPHGPGEEPAAGLGPAHVVALHGFASASAALPLSPDRVRDVSPYAYLNFANLGVFPYTFLQGVIESALLFDALVTLRIPAATLERCGIPAPADGEARLDPSAAVGLGQSMGAMYLNMFGAIEPRIRALAPTGAGGFWSFMILETELIANARNVVASLLRARGDDLTHLHPAMHLMELAWEAAEPIVYVPRISRRPLDGIPSRPIFQPVGRGDSYFPTSLFDAMALAYGHRQAGVEAWPSMQRHLAWAGLDGLDAYPVHDNITSERGDRYTGIVVQHPGDGFSDPHSIFMQIPEIRHQWSCLFRTAVDGTPTVVAPAMPSATCAR